MYVKAYSLFASCTMTYLNNLYHTLVEHTIHGLSHCYQYEHYLSHLSTFSKSSVVKRFLHVLVIVQYQSPLNGKLANINQNS